MRTKRDIKEKNKFRTELEKEFRAIIDDAIQPNSVDQADIDWELDYELEYEWDTQDDIENGDSYYDDLTEDYYDEYDRYHDYYDDLDYCDNYYEYSGKMGNVGTYYTDGLNNYLCCEINYRVYYVDVRTGKQYTDDIWRLKPL